MPHEARRERPAAPVLPPRRGRQPAVPFGLPPGVAKVDLVRAHLHAARSAKGGE